MKGRTAAWWSRRNTYDILAMLLLVICLVLIAVNFSMYPVYLDIPYHMAVTEGFQEAGGVTTWDFWDYAPDGRPHIYPPMLHVSMSLMLDLGLSMEVVATLVSIIMFPLIMLCLWWSMRKLFGSRAAFYSLVLVAVPYMFFWQSGVTIAASIVLALTPLIFVMLEEDRRLAAVILLAMCLYSHLVMGHLVALALLVYMLHRRDNWKSVLTILAFSYLLYLPWGIVVIANLSSFSTSQALGGGNIILHLFLWLLALAGLVICYLRKKHYYLLPAYFLSMVPIVFFYSNRFWEGHIFLPLAMLGAIALDQLHAALDAFLGHRAIRIPYARVVTTGILALLLVLVFCVDPVLAYGSQRPSIGQYAQGGGDLPGEGLASGPQGGYNALTPLPPGQGEGRFPPGASAPYQPQLSPQQQIPLGPEAYSAPQQQENGMFPSPPAVNGAVPGPMPGGENRAGDGPLQRRLRDLDGGDLNLEIQPTTFLVLLGWEAPRQPHDREQQVFGEETTALMHVIEENSEPGDVVYTTDPRLGDLIYAMTGRYSMQGMFHEVQPERSPDPYNDADLLVVPAMTQALGQPGGVGVGSSQVVGEEWTRAAQEGQYAVYVRSDEGGKDVRISSAALPLWAAYMLLFLALALLLVDMFRRRYGSSPPGMPPPPPEVYPPAGERPGPGGYALAVVPAYNEEGAVGGVVTDIRAACPGIDVLVIDDGSRDGTGIEALQAGALVMRIRENVGVGEAVRRGFSYALTEGYRFAVRLDGDGQHPAGFIPHLLRPLERGESEVVVGSRFLQEDSGGSDISIPRRICIAFLSAMLSWRTSLHFTDPTSGFRAYNRNAMRLMTNGRPPRYPEVSSLRLFAEAHVAVKAIPVDMEPRLNGRSSLRGFTGLAMVWGATLDLLYSPDRPPLADDGETAPAYTISSYNAPS